MNGRRPYVRPMAGWWRRNPWFREYMLHEATALFVAGYALQLLAGVLCLVAGESAWNAWLALQREPAMIALALLTLAAFAYHAWSWFRIMPRTLPPLHFRQRRVSARAITACGLALAGASNLLLLALLRWLAA